MTPRRGGLVERLCREEWNLGIIRQSAAEIVRDGIVQPIQWLPQQSPWRGLADPTCYRTETGLVVLAECLNWLTGRGEIWTASVASAEAFTQAVFRPWLRAVAHLSYPFCLTADNQRYLTLEAAETGRLWLWRQTSQTWMQILDRPAIDPTLWQDDNGWWLFCGFADDSPDHNLHLYFADRLDAPWSPHPLNPVKHDLASARSAGPLFRASGQLIRPSQDSSATYGGAIVLNAVTRLDRRRFEETVVRRLAPQDHHYRHGLHTLCPAGDMTIVDGKRWGFNLLDPIRYPVTGVLNRVRKRRSAHGFRFVDI